MENTMKRIIKSLLRRAGWELRRTKQTHRSAMAEGLKRLADHGIRFNTVLDVGASDGRWSAECMSSFPEAKYLLFEPQPVHSHALDVFAMSCKPTVVLIKKAVGVSEGHTFFDAEDPFGGALADREGDHNIKVSLTTIDASISETHVVPPYLLKLDTHGFERSILTGASKTLEHCEALVVEAYNYRITQEAFLFWELCSFLLEKGFRPVDLIDVLHRPYDNALWQMDLFFIKSNWAGFDYNSYK